MKRTAWGGAAIVIGAGLFLLNGRWGRPLLAGEMETGSPPGYVRGVPGPVTSVLAFGRKGVAFAGTGWGVYRSGDGGETWDRVFRAGIWRGPVRALASDPAGSVLYAVAGDGLYRSGEGPRWLKLLSGQQAPLCVAVDPKDPSFLLVGTARGGALSRDGGENWEAPLAGVPGIPVRQALFDPVRRETCYLLSDNGLFRSEDRGRRWNRIRVDSLAEDEDSEAEADPAEEQAEGVGSALHRLTADSRGDLYLGTDQGILTSPDAGATWRSVSTSGIGTPKVLHMVSDPSREGFLYAATPAGFFAYSADWRAWRPVREGLADPGVGSMGLDPDAGQLWVGTRRGLFRLPVSSAEPAAAVGERVRTLPAGPPIAAVQAAAIRYAEVHPSKISRWRALARLKSFIPHFTVGLDQDRDPTIVSSTTQGVTKFTVGPDRETRSLDFGFTWDLADLIWSADQTSIDVRSRLMVQLRQDVLEEVTRLYYERKRVLAEFAAHPSEDPLLDGERSLRVEELTAQLDGLTGGWFSEND